MDTTLILCIAVLGAAVLLLGAALLSAVKERQHLKEQLRESDARLTRLLDEKHTLEEQHLATSNALAALRASSEAELRAVRSTSETELRALRSRYDEALKREEQRRQEERDNRQQEYERLKSEFQNLANEIFGEQSRHFKESNREQIDALLRPFKEHITEFRRRVEEINDTQNSQRGELKNELKRLMDLNQSISTEAQNLTNALKGNSKVQGDWGEMLLETILDNSSLTKGIHYETQFNIKDSTGRNLRPDVLIHLPDNKEIVIDSKVSLTAFTEYTAAETHAERQKYLAAHIKSVREHVNELSRKEYQKLVNSPDFVIMFIPNEPAFLEALKADRQIWADAYRNQVIISSPTHLFALLKIVADLWKYNDQDKNTQEIAACGLTLYKQLAAITQSLEQVGISLGKAQNAYDDVYKRIHTGNDNIVRVGERLRKKAMLQVKNRPSAQLLQLAQAEDDVLDSEYTPQ